MELAQLKRTHDGVPESKLEQSRFDELLEFCCQTLNPQIYASGEQLRIELTPSELCLDGVAEYLLDVVASDSKSHYLTINSNDYNPLGLDDDHFDDVIQLLSDRFFVTYAKEPLKRVCAKQ